MNPATWKTIKETFATALELPVPERDRLLAGSSDEIRREVEKLLSNYPEAQTFIGTPLIFEKGFRPKVLDELTGKKIDDYFVLEKIGEGGMGIVFLAEHCGQGFSKRVALKLIKRGMDTNAVLGRFLMERQILADLEHPNIARLYGGGSTTDGLPYFVMEYVEGESIRDFCDNQRFDISDRLRLFTKVCEAISYAHQQLIVHRDIKPSNIIVTASGEPKLLDFGIAKLLLPNTRAAERTATQFHVMTPEYASPEQLSGKVTTTRTDVYSLGVVLYELLTGTRPFDFKGKSLIEISEALKTQRPLRPSDCQSVTGRAADVSPTTPVPKGSDTSSRSKPRQPLTSPRGLKGDLDNIILQAIRREPERRYQSVVEFSEDIQRYLDGLPVKATGDTFQYRARKFIKRHRTAVTAAICFMLLLLVSTGLTGWQYFVARAQRAKAEERLADLRGVAKSLLTETNAQLKDLPQGIEIRKSVVEKSVAVLDSLAGDESNDPNFLNELANAYAELGSIRHWQFHQSRQALSDFNKAWQLRMRAIALEPKNVESRKSLSFTFMGLSEVYSSLADREGLLRIWQAHLENDHHMIELEPNNPQSYYTASAHSEDLAGGLIEFNRREESNAALSQGLQWVEKAIALQQAVPFSFDGQVLLVTFSMEKAALLHKMGRVDEALAVYQAASDLAQQTYYADKTKRFAFNHASRIHKHMADIYAERGDWQKYLECSEFSLNWISQNRENRSLWSQSLPPTTTYYLMRVGIGLNKLGKKEAATAAVDESIKQYNQSLGTHDITAGDVVYAGELLDPASDFYVETSQTVKAVAIWDNYIALINPFVTRNPQDTSSLAYLSYALERKGDVLAIYRTDRGTFAQTSISSLRAALESYQESLSRRQRILQLDAANQSHLNAKKTLELKLSRLNQRLNAAG